MERDLNWNASRGATGGAMDTEEVTCNLDGRKVLKATCEGRKLSYCKTCDSPTIPSQLAAAPEYPRPIHAPTAGVSGKEETSRDRQSATCKKPPSKKARPRWGWDEVRAMNKNGLMPLSEKQLLRLAEMLEFPLDDELAFVFINKAYAYQFSSSVTDHEPRPAEQRAALKEIHKHARTLAKCMEQLDSKTRSFVKKEWLTISRQGSHIILFKRILSELESDHYPYSEPAFAFDPMKELSSLITWVLEKASAGIDEEVRLGRPKRRSLYGAIEALADIYRWKKGQDPRIGYDPSSEKYTGTFFEFVELFLSFADPSIKIANNALGEAIRRALGIRS